MSVNQQMQPRTETIFYAIGYALDGCKVVVDTVQGRAAALLAVQQLRAHHGAKLHDASFFYAKLSPTCTAWRQLSKTVADA